MIAQAAARSSGSAQLSFQKIDGPALPFADGSFDLVTSFLSFRYLDWDPIMQEIRRVLAPGGHLMIVDMVERALAWRDARKLASSAAKHLLRPVRDPKFVPRIMASTSCAVSMNLNSILGGANGCGGLRGSPARDLPDVSERETC